MRLIFDTLCDPKVHYTYAKSIRLWKTACEDEGVRAVCEYIIKFGQSVTVLEILNCDMTSLGCEFLARCLMPEVKNEI